MCINDDDYLANLTGDYSLFLASFLGSLTQGNVAWLPLTGHLHACHRKISRGSITQTYIPTALRQKPSDRWVRVSCSQNKGKSAGKGRWRSMRNPESPQICTHGRNPSGKEKETRIVNPVHIHMQFALSENRLQCGNLSHRIRTCSWLGHVDVSASFKQKKCRMFVISVFPRFDPETSRRPKHHPFDKARRQMP